MSGLRVLFCASEAFPLIKTGGLADVAGSLPPALAAQGHEVRLVLPAYRDIHHHEYAPRVLARGNIDGLDLQLLEITPPQLDMPVWLVDCPALFDRPGNPYHDEQGYPWPDNAQRFAVFCKLITHLASDELGLGWRADVVHGHDWQTGLALALLAQKPNRPALVFTIHNLAYQGLFDYATFLSLKLPDHLWQTEQLEFHHQFSFMKGGLVFADRINTVSPNYAREIQTADFGHGLDGLLRHRSHALSGIINGIDTRHWDPASDPYIEQTFDAERLELKAINKQWLQQQTGLREDPNAMLLGVVSRLAEQKGLDMLIEALPRIMSYPVQLLVLGSGDRAIQAALEGAQQMHPEQIQLIIGYDEPMAHRIEAGADAFLMPSRFEPCGLNQMYSQRYGALPVVSPVGGLLDTVTDTNEHTLADGSATGFVMSGVNETALTEAIRHAHDLFRNPQQWQQVQRQAMARDFSWQHSAQEYLELYRQAIASPGDLTA